MAYTAKNATSAATREIGTRETGTNRVKYNNWLGRIPGYPHNGYGYPWCASFQSWVADRAGGRAGTDYPRTAGCAAAVAWFRGKDRWSSSPHVGDWVFYGPGGGTHVELVTKVTSSSITTIGGNTSGSLDGSYFNGDGVYRKTVARSSDRIYGYGRPTYKEARVATLGKDDLEAIRRIVWESDKIPAPSSSSTIKTNPSWQANNVLRETYDRAVETKSLVAQLAAREPFVDAEVVAAAVLRELTPERIAAAIPAELAAQVADELGTRISNPPKE